MIIDERCTGGQVRQFAGQYANLSERSQAEVAELFRDDQPDEFYAGLLAGYAGAIVLLQGGAAGFLPVVAAAVAERMERKEIV